jgi:glycine oxidase
MPDGADVIIIGGGIIGCAIARELARRGSQVVLIEGRTIGAGATQASAGILAPYIEAHERGPLFDLTVRSLALYDDFVSSAAVEAATVIDYRRCGTMEVAIDDVAAESLRARAALGAGDGIEWLPSGDARRLEPDLPEGIAGALLSPMHGYVAVAALTEALEWSALRHGAEIETGRHIRRIERVDDRWSVRADDDSTWTARWVVIATGSWTDQIDGVPLQSRAVKPVRGQLVRLMWRRPPLAHVLWGRDCYIVPWQDGTLLVGATVEDVGFDERATAAGVRDLLDAACEILPAAWGATFLDARAGLRPATSDGLPLIGPSPSAPGLLYATGHYRNGILLAPLTAELVADAIVDGRQDPAFAIVGPEAATTRP